jgi:hypothetical protein
MKRRESVVRVPGATQQDARSAEWCVASGTQAEPLPKN